MRDSELRALLRRAGDEITEQDVAESTWVRGRTARRHRWTARVVGGLVAASVVGVLGAQVAGWPGQDADGGVRVAGAVGDGPQQQLELPTLVGEMASVAEREAAEALQVRSRMDAEDAREAEEARSGGPAPEPGGDRSPQLDPSPWLLQGQQVWADVYAGCLEAQGYVVARDGAVLSVTFPEGRQDGDYQREERECRGELVTDPPLTVSPQGGLDPEERAALADRYFQYYWAQGCLVDAGLPTPPTMPGEEFITGLSLTQLPPWHPYQEAAREGRYAEAQEACPIQPVP